MKERRDPLAVRGKRGEPIRLRMVEAKPLSARLAIHVGKRRSVQNCVARTAIIFVRTCVRALPPMLLKVLLELPWRPGCVLRPDLTICTRYVGAYCNGPGPCYAARRLTRR